MSQYFCAICAFDERKIPTAKLGTILKYTNSCENGNRKNNNHWFEVSCMTDETRWSEKIKMDYEG
jgi:hypothetical protein